MKPRSTNNNPYPRLTKTLMVCGSAVLSAVMAGQSQALNLADQPLTVTGGDTGVPPNVMILMDNSGSMNNIMWRVDPNYNPTDPNAVAPDPKKYFVYSETYPTWNTAASSNGETCATDPGNGDKRCLILPNPATDSPKYLDNYVNFLFEYAKLNSLFNASGVVDYTTLKETVNGVQQFVIPQKVRMGTARDEISAIVSDAKYNNKMRFGLFVFNGSAGGNIEQECAGLPSGTGANNLVTHNNAVATSVRGLTGTTKTPLAETYHDITKYFRGEFSTYSSPILWRCQQNFTVVVTDGYPTSDTGINETYNGIDVKNWDGLSPTTVAADFPTNLPPFSDGTDATGNGSAEGESLFLDDLAKFGFDIDLKPGTGLDADNVSFNDPAFGRPAANALTVPDPRNNANNIVYPAVVAKPGHQYLTAHTIGFATDNQMLRDAANYTRGAYNYANSAEELAAAIDSALNTITVTAQLKTVSSVAISSAALIPDSATYVYRVAYNPANWTSSIKAYEINPSDYSLGTPTAVSVPAQNARRIYTLGTSGATAFDSSIDTALKTAIGSGTGTDTSDNRILYLRGDQSNEVSNANGIYRDRISLLGDIINSQPVYVDTPSFPYPDNLESVTYSSFALTYKDRTPMLYVGANDAMIHGFAADPANGMAEKIAYLPKLLLSKVGLLTDPAYSHQYFADGTVTVGDVFYDSAWHSVLVSGLNKGGQGVVGFDVTDPSTFNLASGLNPWEFSDTNDSDLGYTFSRPAIVKMANGKWAAVFGNGYNSTEADGHAGSGQAAVFIYYFADNSFVKLETNTGTATSPNGMATLAPVDVDGDYKVDLIYGGDIQGNLWKFDVRNVTDTQWKASTEITKLFSTCSSQPCTKPITIRPEVGRGPLSNTLMVYFGSGKYLENTDPNDTSEQSFYAIIDTPDGTAAVVETDLEVQTIDTSNSNSSYRLTSANPVYYAGTGASLKKGWVLHLNDTRFAGERVITNPSLRGGRIIFTTNYYSSSMNGNSQVLSCNSGSMSVAGGGFLMELDALFGLPLRYSPFDTNNDNLINDTDKISNQVATGKSFGENLAAPVMLADGNKEVLLITTTDDNEPASRTPTYAAQSAFGYQTWTQLK